MTVAVVAATGHSSRGDVEGGERRRGAVPDVIVGPSFDLTGPQREERLGAVERLDLAPLVDTKHQRLLRRVQVEPDDVSHLLDELRVIAELESGRAVRL